MGQPGKDKKCEGGEGADEHPPENHRQAPADAGLPLPVDKMPEQLPVELSPGGGEARDGAWGCGDGTATAMAASPPASLPPTAAQLASGRKRAGGPPTKKIKMRTAPVGAVAQAARLMQQALGPGYYVQEESGYGGLPPHGYPPGSAGQLQVYQGLGVATNGDHPRHLPTIAWPAQCPPGPPPRPAGPQHRGRGNGKRSSLESAKSPKEARPRPPAQEAPKSETNTFDQNFLDILHKTEAPGAAVGPPAAPEAHQPPPSAGPLRVMNGRAGSGRGQPPRSSAVALHEQLGIGMPQDEGRSAKQARTDLYASPTSATRQFPLPFAAFAAPAPPGNSFMGLGPAVGGGAGYPPMPQPTAQDLARMFVQYGLLPQPPAQYAPRMHPSMGHYHAPGPNHFPSLLGLHLQPGTGAGPLGPPAAFNVAHPAQQMVQETMKNAVTSLMSSMGCHSAVTDALRAAMGGGLGAPPVSHANVSQFLLQGAIDALAQQQQQQCQAHVLAMNGLAAGVLLGAGTPPTCPVLHGRTGGCHSASQEPPAQALAFKAVPTERAPGADTRSPPRGPSPPAPANHGNVNQATVAAGSRGIMQEHGNDAASLLAQQMTGSPPYTIAPCTYFQPDVAALVHHLAALARQ